MPLYTTKMGVHWYFRFAVKAADNRDEMLKMLKFKTFSEILDNLLKVFIVVRIV